MAPVMVSAGALLSLAVLVASKPILPREEATSTEEAAAAATTDIDTEIDVTLWCNNEWTDTLDPEQMQYLWEDANVSPTIGEWLANWAEYVTEDNPNDNWADNIITVADPNIGNDGLGGCGVIGSQCAPQIDCEDWASRGYGAHYWAIQALIGFHDKLNVAHEYLQDETLENFMSLSEIASDFTAPSTWTTYDDMWAVLGTVFYMIGGGAGFIGMGASFAAARYARAGAVKAGSARTKAAIDKLADGPTKDGLQKRLDDSITTAEAMLAKQKVADESVKAMSATGASTYMVGGIFNSVGIGSEDAFGEVESGDLEPVLKEIFQNARGYLEQLGRLATGRADSDKGDDYAMLPGQDGLNGPYAVENDIARFFHDGGMLLGAAHPAFNDTLDAAFATMQPRIVDQALVTGGFYIFADERAEEEDYCKDEYDDEYDHRGSQWVTVGDQSFCMRLVRGSDKPQTCDNGVGGCTQFDATEDEFKNLEEKYQFDMYDYYWSALDCALNGGEDRKPDLWGLPDDGSVPTCWYGIEAKKGLFACEFGSGTCEVKFSEFERNVNVDDVVEEVGSILCTANTLAGGECAGDS